jgi:hypothetical protein
LSAINGAFRKGRLSYAKVRALTRVATTQNESHLLETALVATGAQLERLCRGYGHALLDTNAAPLAERSVRRLDRPGGMVKLHTFLANPKGHGGAGPGFQVMVHVGQDPLTADGVFAATLEDGMQLSAEALRRVTCDSAMVAVSETGQGMTVGRRTRSIPSAMRRALMLRCWDWAGGTLRAEIRGSQQEQGALYAFLSLDVGMNWR